MASKNKSSSNALTVALWILVIVLVAGLTLGVVLHFSPSRENENEGGKVIAELEWVVGGLSEEGVPTEDTDKVYTKDTFGCADLVVLLDADAEFTYQVFFYDDDEKFIEATEIYEESVFSLELPDDAAKARILLIPTGEIEEITEEQAAAMGKQLTVTVAK